MFSFFLQGTLREGFDLEDKRKVTRKESRRNESAVRCAESLEQTLSFSPMCCVQLGLHRPSVSVGRGQALQDPHGTLGPHPSTHTPSATDQPLHPHLCFPSSISHWNDSLVNNSLCGYLPVRVEAPLGSEPSGSRQAIFSVSTHFLHLLGAKNC